MVIPICIWSNGDTIQPFFGLQAGNAHKNFEVTELLKFWTAKVIEIDNCKLLWPSWCPHPYASLIEEVMERVRLSPTKDEDLETLNVIHKPILPQNKEPGEIMNKLEKSMKKMEPGSCLDLTSGSGEHSCDGRSCVRIQSCVRIMPGGLSCLRLRARYSLYQWMSCMYGAA